jgi:hypothetical protein
MRQALVLVVGSAGDWSVEAVTAEITRRGARVFHLTTADFPQRMIMQARLSDGGRRT